MATEEISGGQARKLMQTKNPPQLHFIGQMEMEFTPDAGNGPTYHRGLDSEGRDSIFVWYFFTRYSEDVHTVIDSRSRLVENHIRDFLGVAHI